MKKKSASLALLFSRACADVPNSNNTVFVNPSNTSSDPIVWELGTTQVIQWNTTASPISLDLYQFINETQSYESAYIFYNFENITEFAWTVGVIEPVDSNGEGSFHLKLVPPNYNGLPGEGLDGTTFTIKDPKFNSSSSSSSSVPSSLAASSITSKPSMTAASSSISAARTANAFVQASPAPNNNPTTAPSSGLSPIAKKGLGLGLGLGLTAFLLLNAFAVLWYIRRHKRNSSGAARAAFGRGRHDTRYNLQEKPIPPLPMEVPSSMQKQAFVEVDDTSRGEMDGSGCRAELSACRT